MWLTLGRGGHKGDLCGIGRNCCAERVDKEILRHHYGEACSVARSRPILPREHRPYQDSKRHHRRSPGQALAFSVTMSRPVMSCRLRAAPAMVFRRGVGKQFELAIAQSPIPCGYWNFSSTTAVDSWAAAWYLHIFTAFSADSAKTG